MHRRQAFGLLLIFCLLLAGRGIRHALIIGGDGQWRDPMWLDSLMPQVEDAHAEPEAPPPTGPFNVNKAAADTLCFLPGVGPVLASRIIEERERGGPFTDFTDLQRVKGIGPKLAAKLADHVIFVTGDGGVETVLPVAARQDEPAR